MEYRVFNIIFSVLLVPVNFLCAFWLFREALNLTGLTFKEFLDMTASERMIPEVGRHRFRKRRRFLILFFNEHSSDPQKSVRLLWGFGICTLPALASLSLAGYAAMFADKQLYALIGNLLLAAVNLALFIRGRLYRKNHPLDAATAEKLDAKRKRAREQNGKNRVKNIVVYTLVGVLFGGMLLFFILGMAGASPPVQGYPSAISVHADLITRLNEKGYETANVPTTYWELDGEKLLHVAAGVKGSSKLEFYGYSDDKTVDLVYNQIVYSTAPDMEPAKREQQETDLSGGGKLFTTAADGLCYLVLYRGDTVVYAYAPGSLNEIYEILTGAGYAVNE